MAAELTPFNSAMPKGIAWRTPPSLFARAGDKAVNRLLEFFTAEIRNPHARLPRPRGLG